MTTAQLKEEILSLLPSSTLSNYQKLLTRALLPSMRPEKVKSLYKSLKVEVDKMEKLNKKQKAIEEKYEKLIGKLVDIELNKMAEDLKGKK